jgi:NTE family protein
MAHPTATLREERMSKHIKIAAAQLSRADVVIQPKVGHIDSGDFTKRHEAILEGERAAQAALPKIQALLGEIVTK